MKYLLTLAIVMSASICSAASRDCKKVAFNAAKAVDKVSNPGSSSYGLSELTVIKKVRSGGETLDTYLVRMTANTDMGVTFEVDVTSSFCFVKAVRYITGD